MMKGRFIRKVKGGAQPGQVRQFTLLFDPLMAGETEDQTFVRKIENGGQMRITCKAWDTDIPV